MTYNVPQFRASYLHRQLMCDNYTTLHATLPITISTMCMCMSPTQIRRVEPLKAKQFIPKRASPAAKVRSVCGVHASPTPSHPVIGTTAFQRHRSMAAAGSAAQRSQSRKEKKSPVRTAPHRAVSLRKKPKDPAAQPQHAALIQSRPVQSSPCQATPVVSQLGR
jgi:hypothetical protein